MENELNEWCASVAPIADALIATACAEEVMTKDRGVLRAFASGSTPLTELIEEHRQHSIINLNTASDAEIARAVAYAICADKLEAVLIAKRSPFPLTQRFVTRETATVWWERRGTMIYTEDQGPGTARCVGTCASTDDAEAIVREHNQGHS